MNRKFVSFPISDFIFCKRQLLLWASHFDVCCFLDNHHYSFNHHSFECILAAGVSKCISAGAGSAFLQLKHFSDIEDDWMFGHFSYDLKNELEDLQSTHTDRIGFPDLFWFIPEVIILLSDTEISIGASPGSAETIASQVFSTTPSIPRAGSHVDICSQFSREEYTTTIAQLQNHILKGDCYEINFCQEFFSTDVTIDPLQVYFSLSAISPNPFAAFYKVNEKYLCCASPERYLRKEGQSIISQPMKGTWSRDLEDEETDARNRYKLFESTKERSENVMVVDLVRNDLSRVCVEGTVRVDELYGIYSFPNVHQMVSTVSGQLKFDVHWVDIIKATFPMGSMTGAPKLRVMQLIEKYERSRRGIFSGAVGYVSPEKNFDFNVVIRSILYNRQEKCLSYQVGSGITFYSEAEKEYQECMLKAAAIKKVLE